MSKQDSHVLDICCVLRAQAVFPALPESTIQFPFAHIPSLDPELHAGRALSKSKLLGSSRGWSVVSSKVVLIFGWCRVNVSHFCIIAS